MAEVEAAASAANAHSFITLLPNGYSTQVRYQRHQISSNFCFAIFYLML